MTSFFVQLLRHFGGLSFLTAKTVKKLIFSNMLEFTDALCVPEVFFVSATFDGIFFTCCLGLRVSVSV